MYHIAILLFFYTVGPPQVITGDTVTSVHPDVAADSSPVANTGTGKGACMEILVIVIIYDIMRFIAETGFVALSKIPAITACSPSSGMVTSSLQKLDLPQPPSPNASPHLPQGGVGLYDIMVITSRIGVLKNTQV